MAGETVTNHFDDFMQRVQAMETAIATNLTEQPAETPSISDWIKSGDMPGDLWQSMKDWFTDPAAQAEKAAQGASSATSSIGEFFTSKAMALLLVVIALILIYMAIRPNIPAMPAVSQ
jgi:hypothetical protein